MYSEVLPSSLVVFLFPVCHVWNTRTWGRSIFCWNWLNQTGTWIIKWRDAESTEPAQSSKSCKEIETTNKWEMGLGGTSLFTLWLNLWIPAMVDCLDPGQNWWLLNPWPCLPTRPEPSSPLKLARVKVYHHSFLVKIHWQRLIYLVTQANFVESWQKLFILQSIYFPSVSFNHPKHTCIVITSTIVKTSMISQSSLPLNGSKVTDGSNGMVVVVVVIIKHSIANEPLLRYSPISHSRSPHPMLFCRFYP